MLPRRAPSARAMITPTVTAIATAATNDAETFTGLGVVRKMIADMICGPAIIVIARGRISRLMISFLYTTAMYADYFLMSYRERIMPRPPGCEVAGYHELSGQSTTKP